MNSIFIVIIFFLLNFHIYKLITKQEIIWIVATGLLLVLAYQILNFNTLDNLMNNFATFIYLFF